MTRSRRPPRPRLVTNPWTLAGELAYLALTLGFILTFSFWTMVVWQLVSVATLVLSFLVLRRRTIQGLADPPDRMGLPRVLSWLMPFAASTVGIVGVGLILYARSGLGSLSSDDRLALSVVSATGVVVSWLMLHVGFAQIYDAAQDREETPGLRFPRKSEPRLIDFAYFAFTVGVSFATSDVEVQTSRMRLTVMVHSVVSFFYNAVVVAMAIQVLQSLGTAPS